MIAESATIVIPGVLFLATLIRSAFGFGEALVAVPLLALVVPVEVAAPVAVLVSITVAFIVVVQDWREVHVRSAGALVLPTMLGIPLGLILLRTVSEPVVKGGLAAVIIAFSIYSLLSGRHLELPDDKFAWMFGFSAGVLGGAYGMNGPPLVIYGSLRRWSPQHFRATLQGYFLPASLCGSVGLLACRTVDSGSQQILSLVVACCSIGDVSGAGGQPSYGGSPLPAVCSCRIDSGRYRFAIPGRGRGDLREDK